MPKSSERELARKKEKAANATPEEKAARAAYQKAYYEETKESRKEYDKQYRERAKESGQLAQWNASKQQAANERYANNPEFKERRRLAHKKWYESCSPEVHRARELRHEYGITLERQKAMLEAQKSKCAICSEPMEKPQLDHCHETGMVRALLCAPCNRALGSLRDNPAIAAKAAAYLTAHHPDRLMQDVPLEVMAAPGYMYQRLTERVTIEALTCKECGGAMTGKLANAIYCSRPCKRRAAWMRRKLK